MLAIVPILFSFFNIHSFIWLLHLSCSTKDLHYGEDH